jgi:hypothetical protein
MIRSTTLFSTLNLGYSVCLVFRYGSVTIPVFKVCESPLPNARPILTSGIEAWRRLQVLLFPLLPAHHFSFHLLSCVGHFIYAHHSRPSGNGWRHLSPNLCLLGGIEVLVLVCVGGSKDFRNHRGFFKKGCSEHPREWYDMMKRYKQKHPWTSGHMLPCLSLYMLPQFLGLEITFCSIFFIHLSWTQNHISRYFNME